MNIIDVLCLTHTLVTMSPAIIGSLAALVAMNRLMNS